MEGHGLPHTPKDTATDAIRGGIHVGSSAVRNFILKIQTRRLHIGTHPRIKRHG